VSVGVGGSPTLRLFLHIGVPKTGSTSLQRRFFEHTSELKAQGFLYPLGRFERFPFQHSELVEFTAPERAEALAALLEGIHAEAIAGRCHTVILSGESISSLLSDRLIGLRDAIIDAGFVPTVIVFFRAFPDFVRSVAAELMRAPLPIATPSVVATDVARLSEKEINERFAGVFGNGNVIRHDLSGDDDCVALFDTDIGLTSRLPAPRLNPRMDFATLSWVNALKTEFDIPPGVVQRLYTRVFGTDALSFPGAEAAFLRDVAAMIGGPSEEMLRQHLDRSPATPDTVLTLEARLSFLAKHARFVRSLRRYLWRKAAVARLRPYLPSSLLKASKNGTKRRPPN
jgi:hypothetical protein